MKNTLRLEFFIKSWFALIVFTQASVFAQPALQWERTVTSASKGYTYMNTFLQTPDGGYIMAGQSDADAGGEKSQNSRGETDYWVVKLRPDRSVEWDRTYGGNKTDVLSSVVPTSDGGYLLGGYSNSDKGFEKSEGCFSVPDQDGILPPDYWIVKISANGTKQWDRTYGGLTEDFFKTVKSTLDGGFILGGGANNTYDIWKLNSLGNLEWHKNYRAGGGVTVMGTINTTSDRGYIISGYSNAPAGNNKSEGSKGSYDYWIVKIDSDGTVQWDKTYGGLGQDTDVEATQTSNGGYVVTGITLSSAGGDKTEQKRGYRDAWILKLDSYGFLEWEKTLGGGEYLLQSNNYLGESTLKFYEEKIFGSIVLAGYSNGKANEDKTDNINGAWMVTLDNGGNIISDTTLAHNQTEFVKTQDGGFLLGGKTASYKILKYAYSKPAPLNIPTRINAGGPEFTTATKKKFTADLYYSGIDRTSSIVSGDILNTTNDVLYQSARCSPSFSYNIPVPNGKIDVILHFAETYFGSPGKKGGVGSRRFHVNIEGIRKLTNFDIFVAAGGAMRPAAYTTSIDVRDGMLNIDFLSGLADLPRVSAIEIIPPANFTLQPIADAYVQGGRYNIYNFGENEFLDVKSATSNLFTNKSTYLKFRLPAISGITSAKLRIYGHNHENRNNILLHAYGVNNDSWDEDLINEVISPAASTASLGYVGVNNVYKYYEIDVTSYVKAQQQSGDEVVSLLLDDPINRNTRLIFNSKENYENPPQLIIQTAPVTVSNTREGVEEIIAEKEAVEVNIFPNPASEVLNIEMSDWHKVKSVELLNSRSDVVYYSGNKPVQSVNVKELPTGIYLVRIGMVDGSAFVRKVLVGK